MNLPYIDPKELPESVREKIGDSNFHWESLHDEDFLIDFPVTEQMAEKQKRQAQVMLVAYRKYLEATKSILKKVEKKVITEDQAKELLAEAHKFYETIKDSNQSL